jgi:hypothetical protein
MERRSQLSVLGLCQLACVGRCQLGRLGLCQLACVGRCQLGRLELAAKSYRRRGGMPPPQAYHYPDQGPPPAVRDRFFAEFVLLSECSFFLTKIILRSRRLAPGGTMVWRCV